MEKIIITDFELLSQKNKQMKELQKKIEETEEIKILKKTQQEKLQIKEKIKKYSTYHSEQIGNIIAKLMTEFEGITYTCFKIEGYYKSYNYDIKPNQKEDEYSYLYATYKIKNIDQHSHLFSPEKDPHLCYLPPSPFQHQYSNHRNIWYIQLFIDYLYEKRSSKSLDEISKKELEEILQEFLKSTPQEQQQRKVEIMTKIEETKIRKKREEFEHSCLIDRKLIYNSLSYIINNYEEDIEAIQKGTETWKRSDERIELYGYDNLIIQNEKEKIVFSTIVDHNQCYPR